MFPMLLCYSRTNKYVYRDEKEAALQFLELSTYQAENNPTHSQ